MYVQMLISVVWTFESIYQFIVLSPTSSRHLVLHTIIQYCYNLTILKHRQGVCQNLVSTFNYQKRCQETRRASVLLPKQLPRKASGLGQCLPLVMPVTHVWGLDQKMSVPVQTSWPTNTPFCQVRLQVGSGLQESRLLRIEMLSFAFHHRD